MSEVTSESNTAWLGILLSVPATVAAGVTGGIFSGTSG